jgi:hypothetical protein
VHQKETIEREIPARITVWISHTFHVLQSGMDRMDRPDHHFTDLTI